VLTTNYGLSKATSSDIIELRQHRYKVGSEAIQTQTDEYCFYITSKVNNAEEHWFAVKGYERFLEWVNAIRKASIQNGMSYRLLTWWN
jgi:hypothetical protein